MESENLETPFYSALCAAFARQIICDEEFNVQAPKVGLGSRIGDETPGEPRRVLGRRALCPPLPSPSPLASSCLLRSVCSLLDCESNSGRIQLLDQTVA